jgi:hypothetical protein
VTAIVAQNNKIVALPASIRGLPNLTRLDLDNNLLRHLPSCVYRMANLAHLSVRNNLLTKLEPELINMRKLKVLALDGNPLAYPPLRVASLKLPKLLEWMQKNPSYTVFRTYFDRQAETVSFVDLNIATAHAQVDYSLFCDCCCMCSLLLPGQGVKEERRPLGELCFFGRERFNGGSGSRGAFEAY